MYTRLDASKTKKRYSDNFANELHVKTSELHQKLVASMKENGVLAITFLGKVDGFLKGAL